MIKPKLTYFEEGKPRSAWGDPEPTDAEKQFLFSAEFIDSFEVEDQIENCRAVLKKSLSSKKLSKDDFRVADFAFELLICMAYDHAFEFSLREVSGNTTRKRNLRGQSND